MDVLGAGTIGFTSFWNLNQIFTCATCSKPQSREKKKEKRRKKAPKRNFQGKSEHFGYLWLRRSSTCTYQTRDELFDWFQVAYLVHVHDAVAFLYCASSEIFNLENSVHNQISLNPLSSLSQTAQLWTFRKDKAYVSRVVLITGQL